MKMEPKTRSTITQQSPYHMSIHHGHRPDCDFIFHLLFAVCVVYYKPTTNPIKTGAVGGDGIVTNQASLRRMLRM